MNEEQRIKSAALFQCMIYAAQKGRLVLAPLMPFVKRIRRGSKVSVRGGERIFGPGTVIVGLEDEVIANMKKPMEEVDLWLLARVERATAEEFMGEKPAIVKPGLVDPQGRPIN